MISLPSRPGYLAFRFRPISISRRTASARTIFSRPAYASIDTASEGGNFNSQGMKRPSGFGGRPFFLGASLVDLTILGIYPN
jgi:hypothetical protein